MRLKAEEQEADTTTLQCWGQRADKASKRNWSFPASHSSTTMPQEIAAAFGLKKTGQSNVVYDSSKAYFRWLLDLNEFRNKDRGHSCRKFTLTLKYGEASFLFLLEQTQTTPTHKNSTASLGSGLQAALRVKCTSVPVPADTILHVSFGINGQPLRMASGTAGHDFSSVIWCPLPQQDDVWDLGMLFGNDSLCLIRAEFEQVKVEDADE